MGVVFLIIAKFWVGKNLKMNSSKIYLLFVRQISDTSMYVYATPSVQRKKDELTILSFINNLCVHCHHY